MESWLQRFLLTLGILLSLPALTQAQEEAENEEESDTRTILDAVINPDIERRKIDESRIDTENFEMGMFAGVMSVEDFGSNEIIGMTAAYHISEDWFLEAAFGATKTTETSFETLSGATDLLNEDQRNLFYYNLSLGLNLLPGEVFIGKKYAFNTSYYLIAGAGNTLFADDEFFTLNFGAGFRLFATDWVALRISFRNHLFTHNILGESKAIQNLEASIGGSLYF